MDNSKKKGFGYYWINSSCKFCKSNNEESDDKKIVIPKEFQNEHRLHLMRQQSELGDTLAQRRENMSRKDSTELSIRTKQTGERDVEAIMQKAPYWQYVEKFDRRYYDSVRNLGNNFLDKGTVDKWIKQIKFPIPKQQDQGGGGGMPSLLGNNNNKKIIKNAIYITRDDGKPYRLMGTFGNDILMGRCCYLKPDATSHKIKIKNNGNIFIPGSSNAAKAILLMENLPKIINSMICELIKGKVSNEQEVAESIVSRSRKYGKFDCLPLVYSLKGPSYALALKLKAEGVEIPQEVIDVKKSIGRIIYPYVENLKNGLISDKIEFEDKSHDICPSLNNPSLNFCPSKSDPRILDKMEIIDSSDLKALLMTMFSDNNNKEYAANRIIVLLCKHPEILKHESFSENDIDTMEQNELGKKVSKYIKLLNSDDADVLSSLYQDNEDWELLSLMIANQNRENIINSIPELCINGDSICWPYFCKINPQEINSIKLISKICNFRNNNIADKNDKVYPDNLVDRKCISALLFSQNEDLAREMLRGTPESISFAISWLSENNKLETIPKDIIDKISNNENEDLGSLVYLSLTKNQLHKNVLVKINPTNLSGIGGKEVAKQYMRTHRVDWSNSPIPRSSEIFSAPDNSLSLARNLSEIEDKVGLLLLLRKCVENTKNKNKYSKDFNELAILSWDSLRKMGAEDEARSILKNLGYQFESNTGIKQLELIKDDPEFEDVENAIKNEDEIGAAIMLDRIALHDEQKAVDILMELPEPKNIKLFMGLLPSNLLSNSTIPRWANGRTIVSRICSNGMVVSGFNSSLKVLNEDIPNFSCKEKDIECIINKLSQGKLSKKIES